MHRMERLAEDMRLAISRIVTQEVKHPDLDGMITIVKVDVTPDQKYAKVYTSIFNAKDKQKVINALNKSKGFIQKQVGLKIKMRNIPDITFVIDDSMEYGAHINEVLKKI